MKGKVVRSEKDGGRLEKKNLKCVHYVLRVFFNLFVCCCFCGLLFHWQRQLKLRNCITFSFFLRLVSCSICLIGKRFRGNFKDKGFLAHMTDVFCLAVQLQCLSSKRLFPAPAKRMTHGAALLSHIHRLTH